ncbi:MAG: DUF2087 domain-containing protein [Pseudomonadota bacterium]
MTSATPADTEALLAALRKAMPTATLDRIPKHPERRDLILATISTGLERRYPYTEPELKEALEDALRKVRASVDHVTCRRYLVDCGFLKRDRAGSRYYLNYLKLAETLSEDTQSAVDELVAQALRTSRRQPLQRKR